MSRSYVLDYSLDTLLKNKYSVINWHFSFFSHSKPLKIIATSSLPHGGDVNIKNSWKLFCATQLNNQYVESFINRAAKYLTLQFIVTLSHAEGVFELFEHGRARKMIALTEHDGLSGVMAARWERIEITKLFHVNAEIMRRRNVEKVLYDWSSIQLNYTLNKCSSLWKAWHTDHLA